MQTLICMFTGVGILCIQASQVVDIGSACDQEVVRGDLRKQAWKITAKERLHCLPGNQD